MKKIAVWMVMVLLASAPAFAAAADDYQVIKNAVKGAAASGAKAPLFFKIEVKERKGGHDDVKITLPVALVEIMLDACGEEKIKLDCGRNVDLKKVWESLKAAGPLALVQVEDRDATVKIWLE